MQQIAAKRVIMALLSVIGLALLFFWFVSPRESKKTPSQESTQPEPSDTPLAATNEPALTEPSSPPSATRAAVLPAASAGALDEPQLMTELRQVKDKNPELAIRLAREGNRRFPDSADSAERASIIIHSLASLNRASEARGEAEDMVNHYPDTAWVREIEQFTGAHRHRNLRVNDAGALESY